MGQSIEILNKGFLTLSVEIDTRMELEISSGWQDNGDKAMTSTIMVITEKDLDQIIERLEMVKSDLVGIKTCYDCGTMNHRSNCFCDGCEQRLDGKSDV